MLMKKLVTAFILFLPAFLFSQKDIEINKEFSLFTSENAKGYFKPMFTTIGESFNTGLHTTAFYSNSWSIALDFSVMGMMIPNSQLNYNAELPDLYGNDDVTQTAELRDGSINRSLSGFTRQPTIYGSKSNPIFAAPQNHFAPDSFYKTVAYAEGNNISFMPGVPVAQLVAGFPTRTQLRLRYFGFNLLGEPLTYYTVALNQNIDRFFDLFDEEQNMALAANFAYHSFSRNPGIDISSFAAGLHFSKTFDFGLSLYTGMQYEGVSGSFYAVKEDFNENDVLNSPYAEVRNGDPLDFDIESFTNFRLLGGVSYKIGFVDLHGDIAYASQPVFRAGITLWFMKNEDKFKYIPPEYKPEPLNSRPPDMFAGRLQTEQKIFPARTLKVPEKKIIPPVLNAVTQVYAFVDSIRKPFTKMNLEEYEIRELRALLPYVFFDDNSSVLPERYNKLTHDNTRFFNRDSLIGKNTLSNYYHILNVIGSRMKEYESANITLTGCNSNTGDEKNNRSLSQARADTIKNYLIDVWGIDSSRITTIANNLPGTPSNPKKENGIAENRRVEITSDLWEITAPIIIEDTLRKVNPEIVQFVNEVETEAGLKSWELNVYDQGNPLNRFSGLKSLDPEITWDLNNDEEFKQKLVNSFDYSLEVTDTTNQFYTTSLKSVPVEFKSLEDKRNEKFQDTVYQKYNLILFEFNSSELGSDNQRIVEVIKKRLKQNSEVIVNGYTDIIGDEEYNKKLSERRAKSAEKAVNHSKSRSIGWGESKLLYSNDTPEGRFYCRTVVIDVKTPTNE